MTASRPTGPPPARPPTWTARYDRAALRPPDLLPPTQTQALQQHPAWPALRGWCLRGSGPGTRPWARPGALPAVEERFSVAHLQGDDDNGLKALATALCLERDGSLQLQGCTTAAARLRLRGLTKLHDVMWWRARLPADAWDSGHLIDSLAGLQALARFTPRRATLLVAGNLPAPTLQAVVTDLHARQVHWAQPVRLLVLSKSRLPAELAFAVTTTVTG
ncbi:MAG: hypothetical protein Q8K45_17105 [Rubrivivax sp.]|nr:hypothetical protein [Rubrivivax sp.]